MDDFLTSSSMDKHNEQLLAGLSAPVAPAKKPAMMAPPMAPPPQQPYGMQQPYGYSAPAAGAPPPQPCGMPAAPAPVWPPAGRARCPRPGRRTVLPETDGAAAGRAGGPAARGLRRAAQAPSQAGGDMLGGYDDDFLGRRLHVPGVAAVAAGATGVRHVRGLRVHRGRRQRAADAAAAGRQRRSLPKYTVTFDREAKLGMLLERRAAFAPGATAAQKKARPEQTVVTMVIEGARPRRSASPSGRAFC